MIRFIAVAAAIGAVGGAGGGTLAATVYGKNGGGSAPRGKLVLGQKASFEVPGVGLAAGDQMQRPFDLTNVGKKNFSALAVTTAASPSSPLDSDAANGLQLRIDSCSSGWKKVKGTQEYACKKPPRGLVALRPVIGSGVVLQGLTLAKAKTAHLLLTVSLPATAPNALQGQTTSLTYTFTAA